MANDHTKKLRKLITEMLNESIGETYHDQAPDDAVFPYKVYELSKVNTDSALETYTLNVDIWTLSDETLAIDVDDIADAIEERFNKAYESENGNFPTFFLESRFHIEDPDKHLRRVRVRLSVQNYFE